MIKGAQALHCLAVLLGVQSARTQVSAAETAVLSQLASKSTRIVEIGVFEGLTTRRMIEQMPEGSVIHAVDPFIAGSLGLPYGYWISRSQVARSRRPDVSVVLVREYSHDYAPKHSQEIDLLFIDADHSYEAVRRDWDDWAPKMAPRGVVALHDSQPLPGRCKNSAGPVRLVRELGEAPADFVLQQTVETLSVYRRLAVPRDSVHAKKDV